MEHRETLAYFQNRHYITLGPGAKVIPRLHQQPPFFQQVPALVCGFYLVFQHMGKGGFGHFTREIGLFGTPIPEGASITVVICSDLSPN